MSLLTTTEGWTAGQVVVWGSNYQGQQLLRAISRTQLQCLIEVMPFFMNTTTRPRSLKFRATALCIASLVLTCSPSHAVPGDADERQLAIVRDQAEKGDALAQSQLADAYFVGIRGLPKNEVEAVKWLRKAAAQNDANAQYNLGICYANGQGVTNDPAEALMWIRKAAERNHALAQFILGEKYRDGEGVTKDEAEKAKWYRRAAEQNYADAQYNLGVCFARGSGVGKDEAEAIKWYRKAAAQNHAAAQSNLGVCYAKGLGVQKDLGEAVKLYSKAAAQNAAAAQYNLGHLYMDGEGVEKNEAEAVKWFRKAAEQGHPEAQFKLAVCMAFGRGLPQDRIEAYAWSGLATGSVEPANDLRQQLSRDMTPEQIVAAYRRAKELRAEIETKLKNTVPRYLWSETILVK